MNETIAQCLIDNAQWPSAWEQGAGVDEDTYATLRTAYGHLMGEMPHDRALFDAGQLAYWVSAQPSTTKWIALKGVYE